MVCVGVVLAAGAGVRMGGPKAEVVLSGERLVDRAVRILRAAGCGSVVAVVRDGTHAVNALSVVNPDPGRGMRSSLELGIDAAGAVSGVDAIAVILVDLPGIGVGAARSVITRWRPGRIAVGRIGARSVHPIVMSPSLWREAAALAAPDEGARRYLAGHSELVDYVDIQGVPDDVDTWEELEALSGGTPLA